LIATFGPLGLAGLAVGTTIIAAIFLLPDVPLPLALPFAGLGLVLAGVGAWIVIRSCKWLRHRVEIRQQGIARHWGDRAEVRRWDEIVSLSEWSVQYNGSDYPHLAVAFRDGSTWHFDSEYAEYHRLSELIRKQQPSPAA
jgi:hypothetical protein